VTSERWQKIKTVLEQALELDGPERKAFLQIACEGDDELRHEVDEFLAAEAEAGDFIETPVFRIRLNDAAPLAEGQRLGAYKVVQEIGRGGMGSVYLAERADQEFRQKVALKVLRRGMDTDEIVRRFRSERQILANLNHENIARLLDGGTTEDGRPYLVMEHVEGRPIDEYCDRRKLSTRQRLELFRKVCGAVHFAHQNLVVHRDLKPGNILVTADGVPKLLDFGIAKLIDPEQEFLTRIELRPMTPEYASPEQVRGDVITTASDGYSLGVLLYRLLTGHSPYRPATRDPRDLAKEICEAKPPRPSSVIGKVEERKRSDGSVESLTPESVSIVRDGEAGALRRHLAGDLDTIVLKAMQKDPQRRYSSVDQFSNDIGRHLEGLPVIARKDTLRYRAGKFVGRHKLGVSAAAVVTVLIIGAGINWQRAVREEARAEKGETRAEAVAELLVNLFESSNPSESRGREVLAREMLDSGVVKIKEQLADEPEVLAELMSSIGRSYRGLGLYEPARDVHLEALRLRRQTLGNDHLVVAESLQNLGTVLRELGEDDKAEPYFREGLKILQKSGSRMEYAAALTNLGAFLEEKRKFKEAEELYLESLQIKRQIEGEETIDVGRSYNNLGKLYYAQENYAAAEPNYRKALAIYKRVAHGRPDPEVATTLNNLASLLDSKGKRTESEILHRQALEMRRKLFGSRSPKILSSLNNLAFVLVAQDRPKEAEPLAREAVSIADETLPKSHLNRGMFLRNLAMVLAAHGKGKEGEPFAREALALFRDDDPASTKTAVTESILGGCLAVQGRYAEAEPLLLRSYGVLRQAEGNAEYASAARRRIVDLYTAWEKPERAAEYRTEP
jgi:eukaryotic-like serine/threonine-protein kinase